MGYYQTLNVYNRRNGQAVTLRKIHIINISFEENYIFVSYKDHNRESKMAGFPNSPNVTITIN